MRTDIACRCGVAVSQQSTSLCLRYVHAKPSVWLSSSVGKPREFNNFDSDYPLNLSWSRLGYFSLVENWFGYWFLVSPSQVLDCHAVVRSRLPCLACIISYSSNDLAFGPLIAEAVAKLFVPDSASRLSWPADSRCIALHKPCLKLQGKLCLTSGIVSSLVHAPFGDSSGNICSDIGPTLATENHVSVELGHLTWHWNGSNYADCAHLCGH
jgi:hypothetical protein